MSYEGSDYYDCTKNDELMMEPRLLEYIKRKQFYKENGIESEVLDRQYAITKTDLTRIKNFLRGEKDTTNEDTHRDFIDPTKASFPSSEFKKDARLDRIKAKQQKEQEASEQRHDYNVISKSYDMYRNDRPFASASGNDFKKSGFHPNEWLKNSKDEMQNEYNDKPARKSFSQTNTYVNPKSSYNGYLARNTTINNKDNGHTIDEIIGNLNSYADRDRKYSNYSRKQENENNYQPVPFMRNGENGVADNLSRDIDVDTLMRFGTTPLRGGKSLGYKSVAEHSFSYITPDIQNPDHVVMDRGVPSRAFNKETARPYNRKPVREGRY
jgi:hypothetical protein